MWHSERECHHLAIVEVFLDQVRAGVPPREIISLASGWQVIPSPSTIVTLSCHASGVFDAVIMHTGRVSCHRLHPSTNHVWRHKSHQHPRTKQWVFFFGFGLVLVFLTSAQLSQEHCDFRRSLNPCWTAFFHSLLLLDSFRLQQPSPIHLPCHFFPSESMAESTGAPFAVTYGEQGRHCERVALSGAVT